MAKSKYIYQIDEKDSFKLDKWTMGSKGYHLMLMKSLGLPVPLAFVVTTDACRAYLKDGKKFFKELEGEIVDNMRKLEKKVGRQFGCGNEQLLVSVRSGAPISMPGMMDTVLNLGLNDKNAEIFKEWSGDGRFAYDCYRRFITMFGDVALGVRGKIENEDPFDDIVHRARAKAKVKFDNELTEKDWREVCDEMKSLIKAEKKQNIPDDPIKQLFLAIEAVFKSWNNPRAITYRKNNNIDPDMGTGVVVQMMVFGNRDDQSASGVAFTRDPGFGTKEIFGDFLVKAQGEDVVAGIRDCEKISDMKKKFPKIYKEFESICEKLEKNLKEMQDIEFTIESGKLYILQTRTGQRTAIAAVKIAVDMVKEKLITKEQAILRIKPDKFEQLLYPIIDPKEQYQHLIIGKGNPASPGAAVGTIVLSADRAKAIVDKDKSAKVILVSEKTTPEDIHGMIAAQGIVTQTGGKAAHAAVVARGMGKACIVGCSALKINHGNHTIELNGIRLKEGDWITIEGTKGEVIKSKLHLIDPVLSKELKEYLDWADTIAIENHGLAVRANADIPSDAESAIYWGAKGIGLCRTEHMFRGKYANLVAELIVILTNPKELDKAELAHKEKVLKELEELQTRDFAGLFKVMEGHPVTIRLIDPPLHEFLPNQEKLKTLINDAKKRSDSKELEQLMAIKARLQDLHEENPMLGLRGCRLGIRYPEIMRMQVRAIFRGAIQVKKQGKGVLLEIMIPLVSDLKELQVIHEIVTEVAQETMKQHGVKVDYLFGTMIEIPRAALIANEIATLAEFFSFGTNDLTQMGYGISRDDAEDKFLRFYVDKGVMTFNPFANLDQKGIGQLMEMAIERGISSRKDLKLGICGEHGGDASSVEYCHKIGLAYVSCVPMRVPVSRFVAAQASLEHPRKGPKGKAQLGEKKKK